MLRVLVHDTSIGGLMIRQGRASNLGCTFICHLFLWPTVLEEGCFALSDTQSLLEVGVPGQILFKHFCLTGFSYLFVRWEGLSGMTMKCVSCMAFD